MKILILITFLFGFQSAHCQVNNKDDEQIYFLMGLMNDYLGRVYSPNDPAKKYFITDFYSSEQKALEAFVSAIKTSQMKISDFEISKDGEVDIPAYTTISSEKFINLFNQFYRFKKADYKYEDKKGKEFSFYWGIIKYSKFKNNTHKKLFLKGAFIRSGSITLDGNYQYVYSNPISKHNLTTRFLNSLGCKILEYKEITETIPASVTIIFKPTEELKNFLIY
ncbi:MAG: hypothetical protein RQ735_02160 [Flavobacteriaceae bacterium]|nr:hypothetical protein [Flavobacteriaceae bacterium]